MFVVGTIDFQSIYFQTTVCKSVLGPINSLVTDTFQNIFFFV